MKQSRITALVLGFAFLALVIPPVLQAGETAEPTPEERLLCPPAIASGDVSGLYRHYLTMAHSLQDPALATLAVRMAADLDADLLPPSEMAEKQLEAIIAKEHASPWLRDAAQDLLGREFGFRGETESVRALALKRGIVPSWHVIGPFGRYGRANFYTTYGPEQTPDLAATHPGTNGTIEWRAVPEAHCLPAVQPWNWVSPPIGVVFLQSRFRVDTPTSIVLHVQATASFQVQIDGEVVLYVDRLARETGRDVLSAPMNIPAGAHALVVKLYGADAENHLLMRILDRDHQPAAGLTWGHENELPGTIPAVADKNRIPRPAPHLNQIRTSCEKNATTWPQALAAAACREQKMRDTSLQYARRAVAGPIKSPYLHFLHAQAEVEAEHLSENRREHAAKVACQQALKMNRSFVPAHLMLARYARERSRYVEADTHCRNALNANANAIEPLLFRMRTASSQRWDAEALTWRKQLVEQYPDTVAVHDAVALDAYRRKDFNAVLKARARITELRKNDAAAQQIWLAQLGRSAPREKALAALHKRLDDALTPGRLAVLGHFLAELGALDDAEKAFRDSLAMLPDQPHAYRRLGNILLQQDRRDEALSAYRKSLHLRPEQHDLRRLIAEQENTDYAFWTPYARDAKTELVAALAADPRGPTVRVIDQTILTVYPDGSFVNFTHELQKVLTRSGIPDARSVPIAGEMLEARTILPDGRTLEPVLVPGKSDFTMPGLTIGAAVEDKYVQESNAPFDRSFRFPKWYFRSPNLEEEFLLSEYIIRVPQGYPFVYAACNIDAPENNVEFTRTTTDNGWTVYHWVARQMPRPAHEEGSLDIDESLPFVEIGGRRTWEDINRLFMNAYIHRIRPAHNILETVKSLTEGATSARQEIERLHRFVCREITPAETSAPASEMLQVRAGDRDVILMALLREAGFSPRFVAVRPPKSMLVDPNWSIPQSRHFPLRLILLPMENGAPLWLDTRYATLGAGEILEDISGATAFVVGKDAGEFATVPVRDPSEYAVRENRHAVISRFITPSVTSVYGERIVGGKSGQALKEELFNASERQKRQVLEDHLYKALPGLITAKLSHVGLDQSGTPYHERYEANVPGLLQEYRDGTVAFPMLLTPLSLLPEPDTDPNERESSYHLRDYLIGDDTITIEISEAGATVKHLPDDLRIRNQFGYYTLHLSQNGRTVTIRRRYQFTPQRITRSEIPADQRTGRDAWEAFVEMAQAIERTEQEVIEFKPHTTTTKDASQTNQTPETP